jgi:hypothetical protein
MPGAPPHTPVWRPFLATPSTVSTWSGCEERADFYERPARRVEQKLPNQHAKKGYAWTASPSCPALIVVSLERGDYIAGRLTAELASTVVRRDNITMHTTHGTTRGTNSQSKKKSDRRQPRKTVFFAPADSRSLPGQPPRRRAVQGQTAVWGAVSGWSGHPTDGRIGHPASGGCARTPTHPTHRTGGWVVVTAPPYRWVATRQGWLA